MLVSHAPRPLHKILIMQPHVIGSLTCRSHGFPQAWLPGLWLQRPRALKSSSSTLSNHKIMGLPPSQEPGSSALVFIATSPFKINSLFKVNPQFGLLMPLPLLWTLPSLSIPYNKNISFFDQDNTLLILPLEQRISGLKAMVGNLKTKV